MKEIIPVAAENAHTAEHACQLVPVPRFSMGHHPQITADHEAIEPFLDKVFGGREVGVIRRVAYDLGESGLTKVSESVAAFDSNAGHAVQLCVVCRPPNRLWIRVDQVHAIRTDALGDVDAHHTIAATQVEYFIAVIKLNVGQQEMRPRIQMGRGEQTRFGLEDERHLMQTDFDPDTH